VSEIPSSYLQRPKGFAGERPIPKPPAGAETLRGVLAMLGPAYIMAAMEVGSGELVFSAQAGARVGLILAWTLLLSAIFKTTNNEFAIRYVMATGESPVMMYQRIHPVFCTFYWVIQLIVRHYMFWPAGAALTMAGIIIEGYGVKGIDPVIIGLLLYAIILPLLLIAKKAYEVVEKACMVMVVTMFISMLIIGALVSTPERIAELFIGLFSFGVIPAGTADIAIRLLAWAFGGGPEESLKYGIYVREKGYGMASEVPKLVRKSGSMEEPVIIGWKPSTDPESIRRWRIWLKIAQTDLWGIYLPMGLIGSLIFMYCATWLLKPAGLVPAGYKLAVVQAEFFRRFFGEFGAMVYLFLAMVVLWSTAVGNMDSYNRIVASALRVNFPFLRKVSEYKLWSILVVLYFLLMIPAMVGVKQPEILLLIDIYLSVLLMALAFIVPFIANILWVPKQLRPHPIKFVILAGGIAFYLYFAILILMGVARP